jgi:hypothetical protein
MKPVKLGNEKALQITNTLHINELNNKIETNYNVDIEYKRYHFLDKNRATELKQKDHSFVLNTYGPKYLLFLTHINFKPYALYINRKNASFFLVKTRFNIELYDDTILEGETIKIGEKWFFYVSDCLVYRKQQIILKPYSQRYDILCKIIEDEYVSDPYMEPFRLIQKKRFLYKDIINVKNKYIEQLPFKVNGYLFKCENNASYDILYIFPECRNKKSNDDNSVKDNDSPKINISIDNNIATFLMKTTEFPDVYEIFMFNKNKKAKVGYAGIPNIGVSIMVKSWFQEKGEQELYAKFEKNIINEKWIPISTK